jgi:ATP-binding cassette, subfamily B, multidrug efflux pump
MRSLRSLRRLLPFLRPYRVALAVGVLLVIASSAFGSVIPWLLRRAVDAIARGEPVSSAWRTAGLMILLALLGGALRYGMRELMNGLSRRVEYDLRNALFRHLETLDAAYFAQVRTGDVMARLTNDLSAVRMAAGPAIMYLANTVFGAAFALVFMLDISPRLTVLALLPMAILPVLMAKMGGAVHDRYEAVQEHFSTLTTQAQENLSGARIVRAYRQEAAEVERFRELNEEYVRLNMRAVLLYGTMNPAFGLLAGIASVVVLGVGGRLMVRGTISVGEFVAFGMYLGMLTWPMIALGWVTNLFQRGGASMGRLVEVFDARSALLAPATTTAAVPRHLPPVGPSGGRSIEFREVSFQYPAAEGEPVRPVLTGVSFTIPAGGTLGVVGATGSGKSALIDLIPRIYDPQEGTILVDGVPIREVPLEALRREIGFVPQESLLFSDTIGANIGYGLDGVELAADDGAPAAGTAPEEVRWAAGIAQLDETIAGFPGGYETVLGERGINLSGGQKQRAALARALARRPSIVLLDDALSAVDTHTEAEILRSLREALAGRTAVIASHRISAIRDASWIIVLDDGRIVEQGRHDELLALGGRYASLLRRQQLEDSIEEDGTALASAESRL